MQIRKLFAIAIAALLHMTIAVFQTATAQLAENSTTSTSSTQENVSSTAIARSTAYLEQMSNFIQSCASRLQGGDMSVVSECSHVFAAFNDKMTQLFREQKAFFDHILYGIPLR